MENLGCFLHTSQYFMIPTEVAVRFGTPQSTWALSLNLLNQ